VGLTRCRCKLTAPFVFFTPQLEVNTNCTTLMSQPQLHRTVSDNTVI
jgi:hypothetical protein